MAGNRILYFYLLLLSFIFFVLFDVYLFHLLLLFLLLLPVLSLLLALPVSRTLRYGLTTEDDIVPKGRSSIGLLAENVCRLPCACVRFHLVRRNALGRVRDQYTEDAEEIVQFSLAAGRTFTLRPVVRMPYCGRVDMTVRRVEVTDMLGLFCLPVPKKNELSGAGSVYVLPELQRRTIMIEDAADLGLDSSTYSTEKPGGDPAEIHELRDYREGDAQHSIHWKLSSRMNRLIVREFGLPLNPSLHFLLELRAGATPAAAEAMLGAALAFSEYLMAREVTHDLSYQTEDGTLRTVAITGADALAAAMHELLALPGQRSWSALSTFAMQDVRQPETHLIYLVAGAKWNAAEDADAKRLIASLVDLHVCRRLTLMADACGQNAADALRELGCEVQLLDGSVPGMETEEAL